MHSSLKTVLAVLVLILRCSINNGQPVNADSLRNLLRHPKEDTLTIHNYYSLADKFFFSNRDSFLFYTDKGFELSKKLNDEYGEAWAYYNRAIIFSDIGNTTQALALYFKTLHMCEHINRKWLTVTCLINISSLYDDMLDEKRALEYSQKAYALSKEFTIEDLLFSSAWDNGFYFTNLNMLDSALYYFQEAYQLAQKQKDYKNAYLGQAFSGLGYVNSRLGNYDIALPYLKKASDSLYSAQSNYYLCYNYGFLAELHEKAGNRDSCISYCIKQLEIAKAIKYTRVQLDAYEKLIKVYQQTNPAKAFEYYQQQKILTDSLYSADKNWEILNLTADENTRQKEAEEKKAEELKQHRENIQYAAITVAIVTLVILFLLLSRSIIVNERFVKFLSVVNLLIIFEFINLLAHSYIESLTNHSPVYMLLILVMIAALIVPLHHSLEKVISKRMVEKNKKIRLAAAKKTIAKLEGK